ncbi:MAG: inorganic phosphate transporter [Gammaproteobacteria bacterium]|mgnify:FL=1|jgi:PiT family inorganic phosphate transporter|nr:inorganic phosphate transporter [Gammaproteobacteria bacterium]MBT3867380.1 inorganic phosphate transporter [Gammaproteobacteria bacterium]MBT4378129.1 inorganic phosphate transporter [Gammaproteobacteria bacterium]MBT4614855.1 inorganic phosphate transporter [Gammaproteobacteria bacterium]MBT5198345.1 inorganic phosphate transporter [Gammaproteobacteria bacterium]
MGVIEEFGSTLLILTVCFGFFMAWGVGANDVANAMGTSVGAKAITIKQAILIAMVFEFAGAYLAGGEVTSTIRKGIIDPELLSDEPELLVYGMMSALLAAGIWLFIATTYGWPVSTTHSIVGAIVGFASVGISVDAVNWMKVGNIAASWVVSPVLAGTVAFFLYMSVRRFVFDTTDPFASAKRVIPFYIFLVGFVISMVTMVKGLKHIGLDLTFQQAILYSMVVAGLVCLIGVVALTRIKRVVASLNHDIVNIERMFGVLMLFTACAMAFAHGSNDVANAIGPLAAVNSIIESGGDVVQKARMPTWILFLGGAGIVAGLAIYGYRVMQTIGTHITELTPSSGFAAELAAATTVVLASAYSLPVSTTHTLVGGVLGVGLAKGLHALNLRVVGTIFLSWLVTLPAGAILAIIFFYIFKAIFGTG